MDNMKVFSNEEFGEVRTVIQDGEVWFVGKDVAEKLGYSSPSVAISKKVDIEDKGISKMETPGGVQDVSIINESGLYSLVLSSKLDSAKRFKRWVTKEVLPSIRENGMYATDSFVDKALSDPQVMIDVLIKFKQEKEARIEAEKTVHILTHVNKTYTATEVAKELGFKSAIALNNDLQSKKIQFKSNGTWVLYGDYSDVGYTDIKQTALDSGKVVYDRRFTQRGREFLLKLYDVEVA